MPHQRDGQQLGVAAGRRRAWPGGEGDGPGADRVIDQHVHVDEQILGWQHGKWPLQDKGLDTHLFLAEATSRQGRTGINPHNAPKGIQVPSRPLELATRQAIDQALASLGVPWNGGPYAEPGRDLLARYERPLRQAFARFEGLLDRVREAGGPYVITHGEPHPGNLLRTRAGLCLVDWDMTALARPERDLWWVISGDQDAARYSWRTGWTVNQDALALYRLRWGLDDIAEFLSEIRGPHQRTADTLVSWTGLQETLESIAGGLTTP